MAARIRCSKCEAESYYDGKTKIYCPTCFAQLEAENEQLEKQKDYWWRKACGRFRILSQIKDKIMPPEEYYEWVAKYINDEEANLQKALGGK